MTAEARAAHLAHRRQLATNWRRNRGIRPRPQRLFPLAPLLAAIANRGGIGTLEGQLRTAEENRLLGLGRARRREYALGGMCAYTADALAVRCGLHPAEVWDGWHTAADLDALGDAQ